MPGRAQTSRGKSLPPTKLTTSDGWTAWSLIKEELGRGGDGRGPHVWLTTSAFACIVKVEAGSFTTREMYTTFSPRSIPESQNWEQFPRPVSIRVRVRVRPSLRYSKEGRERVRKLATFQPHPRPKPPPRSPALPSAHRHRRRGPLALGTPETTPTEPTDRPTKQPSEQSL